MYIDLIIMDYESFDAYKANCPHRGKDIRGHYCNDTGNSNDESNCDFGNCPYAIDIDDCEIRLKGMKENKKLSEVIK